MSNLLPLVIVNTKECAFIVYIEVESCVRYGDWRCLYYTSNDCIRYSASCGSYNHAKSAHLPQKQELCWTFDMNLSPSSKLAQRAAQRIQVHSRLLAVMPVPQVPRRTAYACMMGESRRTKLLKAVYLTSFVVDRSAIPTHS